MLLPHLCIAQSKTLPSSNYNITYAPGLRACTNNYKYEQFSKSNHPFRFGFSFSGKIRTSDSLFAINRQLILDLPKMFEKSRLYPEDKKKKAPKEDSEETLDFPLRRMQLYVRPHIFMLELIEKKRIEGITFLNLVNNLEDLCKLLEISHFKRCFWQFGNKTDSSNKVKSYNERNPHRINTLCADYFYNVGNILFFKNQNYSEAYEHFVKNFQELRGGSKEPFASGISILGAETLKGFIDARKGNGSNGDYIPSLTAYFYYRQALPSNFACSIMI